MRTRRDPWWLRRYFLAGAITFAICGIFVVWTELLSCPDCPGQLVMAAGYAKLGSRAKITFAYSNPSRTFGSSRSLLSIDAVTPEIPVVIALSDISSGCKSGSRSLPLIESFNEAAIATSSPWSKSIVEEIKNQKSEINVYAVNPKDLPVECELSTTPTWLYFEARRLRLLHWISAPQVWLDSKGLVPSDSDTFELNEPDAQDVRIDDTTGSFQVTKPGINTVALRGLGPDDPTYLASALTTIDWTTRRRNHLHELVLFLAAGLVGVGTTCFVEELRRWLTADEPDASKNKST
jgi:hypothetical protein